MMASGQAFERYYRQPFWKRRVAPLTCVNVIIPFRQVMQEHSSIFQGVRMAIRHSFGLIVALLLMETLWAQPAVSSRLHQAMQQREKELKNEKTLWEVRIQEEYTDEFLEQMAATTKKYKESISTTYSQTEGVGSQASTDTAIKTAPNTVKHSGEWEVCRNNDIIRVAYNHKLVVTEVGKTVDTKGIAYFGEGLGIYLPMFDPAEGAGGSVNVAHVIRYTRHAAYYLTPTPEGRDLQPPDLVMLSELNPLMMFWADSAGWVVAKEDERYMVVEKQGTIPCLQSEYPLRVRVWLDKQHGFLPYRVEKYLDAPWLASEYKSVAREVWQVSRYARVNGVYRIAEFSYTYYIKGRLVNGKLVYDGKKRIDYRLKKVGKCQIGKIDLPDNVLVADFSLSGKDPVFGTLDRAVAYRWSEYRRLLNEDELKALFQKQFPEPEERGSSAFWKALAYVPPILIILLGLWLIKRRK
jgi:hypothetical protein